MDINKKILKEKEKLHKMILENNCEFQTKEILSQSRKVDKLIVIYLCSSERYVAATMDKQELIK